MSDLGDFKRIVHEPQVRALREKNRELRVSLEVAEARCARLNQALEELAECVLHGWTSPAFARSKLHDRAVEIARIARAGLDTPTDSQRGLRPVIAPWPKNPAWERAADSQPEDGAA